MNPSFDLLITNIGYSHILAHCTLDFLPLISEKNFLEKICLMMEYKLHDNKKVTLFK